MAGYESSSSTQVSSLDINDYNQLLHDFEELHNEANKISALNNRLKGLNNWLEKKGLVELLSITFFYVLFGRVQPRSISKGLDSFILKLLIFACQFMTLICNYFRYHV